jgi:hypothetical protein
MMTTERALAHFDAVNLDDFQPGGNLHIATIPKNQALATTTAAPGDPAIVTKICAIYHTIKPYLQLVVVFPFMPTKVKAVINSAIFELDKLCP